jgi:hypothetical protein
LLTYAEHSSHLHEVLLINPTIKNDGDAPRFKLLQTEDSKYCMRNSRSTHDNSDKNGKRDVLTNSAESNLRNNEDDNRFGDHQDDYCCQNW